MNAKYFLFSITLFSFIMQANGQYKRRGETLSNPRNKSAKAKKSDYSIAQLKGKWQEFERKDRSSTVVAFNDSIQLIFSDSNKVQTRTSIETSMSLVGEAEIDDDNVLTVAADEYTIKSLDSTQLLLDDNDRFIHRLRKVDTFWYEKLGKISVKPEDYGKPITVGINTILGKWFVYRRRADPGATSERTLLIKYLNIPNKMDEHTAAGDITFYQGQAMQQLPCTVTLSSSNIKIVAGKNTWSLSVYEADANNFIFGNSSLLYFSKPITGN